MLSRFIAMFLMGAVLVPGLVQAAQETTKAPEEFKVRFETSAGDFEIEVVRKWAPVGADHFYQLVTDEYYDETRFFRVVPGFVVQFGMHGDPAVHAVWEQKKLPDEPVVASNMKGFVTYAKGGPNTRTTQLFINLGDNQRLDRMGFPPFGRVTKGMEVVEKINSQYGEQPSQRFIKAQGNKYLKARFPDLDYIKKATVLKDEDKESSDQDPAEKDSDSNE